MAYVTTASPLKLREAFIEGCDKTAAEAEKQNADVPVANLITNPLPLLLQTFSLPSASSNSRDEGK